jgi:cytochrome c553
LSEAGAYRAFRSTAPRTTVRGGDYLPVNRKILLGALLTCCSTALVSQTPGGSPLERAIQWAYPATPPPTPGAPPPPRPAPETPVRVPGSAIALTLGQTRNTFDIPDWQPHEHPPMPSIVAHGHRPDVLACGYCHLPGGGGRPENAALAGLPRDYIVEQVMAFRNGDRRSTAAGRQPVELMIRAAKGSSDAEIQAAADYFTSIKYRSFTKVVEAARVPRTLTNGFLYLRDPAGGSEAIGERIIEMPVDTERFELRDPAGPFIAYVPVGSIARGARLVQNWGGGGVLACSMCHGEDLRGLGDVPPLAGRSPTYLARQLNDFKTGARHGGNSEAMKPVVASMRNADIVALVAYIGSRKP